MNVVFCGEERRTNPLWQSAFLAFAEFGDSRASQCIEEMTKRIPIESNRELNVMLYRSAENGKLNILNALIDAQVNVNELNDKSAPLVYRGRLLNNL